MADFQGIIVIHKEKGFTSHDVVAKLRGILHMKKIGHTGTLDPDATGVLPVALGKGTKLVDLLTDKEKTYEAVLHLGIDTDTQDMSGTVLEEKPVNVTEDEVRKVLKSFVGEQLQIPQGHMDYFAVLWKQYFATMEIRERHNEQCQNHLLPKWYRKYMTEWN